MPVPQEIIRLVERFDSQCEAYQSGKYNEAQIRAEFIDPLFKTLGWDIHNEQGYAEAYKDVIHEDAIKIGGATEAPDLCFRTGGTRKFFVECKKPSVNIKDDVHPAYQLRRYAWSARLPLSILTDFHELAVYDCRAKPNKNDTAAIGRLLYFTSNQFAEKWDEFSAIFSREAVLKGSFDKFAESTKGRKGTASVDDAFLEEIERWRDMLARNIASRNEKLSQRELNFAVQRIIDRIIFLRICEDRGIEPYGRLMTLRNGERAYPRLGEFFQRADERYNSGIFCFTKNNNVGGERPDELTLTLAIDDKVIKDIVGNLYYPESPYEFSVLPADILGQVYERFLGKVIRLTAGHQAKVEDKPEVRKAGGVYYTPTYIVDYIVKNTVGKLLEDIVSRKGAKSPRSAILQEVAKLKILDPACGSGSFLLGAYQYLLNWHRDYYVNAECGVRNAELKKGKPPIYQASGGDYRLTTDEKKRILLNNIFGVDIDSQAVEVTKLSLLLKVLEGESQETITKQFELFNQRALPDLGSNIKCGNSLIGPDLYRDQQLPLLADEDKYRINAFDWHAEFTEIFKAGGFDAVIGNPPYGMVQDQMAQEYFVSIYKTPEGRFDHYEIFLEKALSLALPEAGRVMFIIPSPFLSNVYSRKLRQFLMHYRIEEITNFGMNVFRDPTVHSCIIGIRKSKPVNQQTSIRKQVAAFPQLSKPFDFVLAQISLSRGPNDSFDIFASPEKQVVLDKIEKQTKPLSQLCFIRQCIKTGDDKTYVTTSAKHMNEPWKPSLRGRSIERYETRETDLWIKYGTWLARNWQNTKFYEVSKIAVRETGNRITATIDEENRYFLSSLYSVYPKNIHEPLSLRYLLGIINSRLATWYVKVIAFDLTKGAFTKIRTNQFGRLPIRSVDFSNPTDKSRHDKMVALVEQMLDLHKRVAVAKTDHERTLLERQISATDREIDRLVYELYGLTDSEIAIVGESANRI